MCLRPMFAFEYNRRFMVENSLVQMCGDKICTPNK